MKTKPLISILAFVAVIALFYACTPEESIQSPKFKESISELEKNTDYSVFTEALKTLNNSNTATEEQTTLFAVSNEGLEKSLSDGKKAPAQKEKKASGISQEELKRHIAKGKFGLEDLKKKTSLETLSGETLYITVENETVYINGVALSISTSSNSSTIFYIGELLPKTNPESKVVFTVYECNTNWSPENPEQGTPSEGATIKLFDSNRRLSKELTTNENGQAVFFFNEKDDFFYLVEKGELRNLYENWLVLGLFVSQEEIDNSPAYPWGKTVLGDLKLADINGDGIINNDDKIEYVPVSATNNSEEVYMADINTPRRVDIEVVFQHTVQKYQSALEAFNIIDSSFSQLQQRIQCNTRNSYLLDVWYLSYQVIISVNFVLDKISSNSEQYANYKGLLHAFRASLYYNLSTIFGGVPIEMAHTPTAGLPRSSMEETNAFIPSEYEKAFQYLPASDVQYAPDYAAFLLQKGDYNQVIELSERTMQNLGWNLGDENRTYIVMSLLYAEASVESGRVMEAAQLVNRICEAKGQAPYFSNGATREEVRTGIRNFFSSYDVGFKYKNIVRWNLNADWESKYLLLPIPLNVVLNENITQNPGW